jgi:processive 1,2-diacylglycerol beta-glucosyltransferase
MATQVCTGARVLVVSGSFGAGHDRAAGQLAVRLNAAGLAVDRADFVALLPAGLGRLLRASYRAQLRTVPASWEWVLSAAGRGRGHAAAVRLCGLAGAQLLRLITRDTIAVVSTYPLASQALGLLRLAGRLPVPAVTLMTDMSVHPLWVGDGVDAHWAIHAVPAGQARALGAANVTVSGPMVAAEMRPAAVIAERSGARAAFGLPRSGRLALVVTGSWGVGQLLDTARDIAATGLATPVVACGQNTTAQRRITRAGAGIALGWVDDMAALYRACDVVVQSGGGMSSLEALACGLPVLSYRALPGHGRTNAAALQQAGWAPWVRDRAGLAQALAHSIPAPVFRSHVDVAALVGHLAGVPAEESVDRLGVAVPA